MKKTLLLSFTCFTFLFTQAQDPWLNIDRIFQSSEFSPERFGPAKWIEGGEAYTTLETSVVNRKAMDIIRYDAKSGQRSVLVAADMLIPEGKETPLRIRDYSWSNDKKKLLIFTNTRKVWRLHTRGDYWVLDLERGKLQQLGKGLPEATLMFTKFSPDDSRVAYVSQHNIYVESLADEQIIAITEDGSERLINGTFDWAYEEEFRCRDGFRWSPDGEEIAYWQVDASGIRDFYMINNTDSVYSFIVPVQYPKVGETPSACRVGVISAQGGETRWMDVPGNDRQNYLPRMMWHPDANRIFVQQLNRKQNHLKIYSCMTKNGKATQIYEEMDDAWIDAVKQEDWIWLEKGAAFTWLSEKDGWRHLYRIQSDGSGEELVTKGDYDVVQVVHMNEAQNEAYFIASPENPTQRYGYKIALDGSSNLERVSPADQPGTHSYTFAPNGKYAFHSYSSLMQPTKQDVVAFPGHQRERFLVKNESLTKGLKDLTLPQHEFFQITTEEGVEMEGYMLKPPAFSEDKQYPVLFYVYGEPAGQTGRDSWGGRTLWHAMMAQQGYLVITMDNRGTPAPKGRAWRKSIYRKIGIINAHDQAMATREILKWKFVDPDRIGVWGWSGGGSMTLNLLFKYPEIYKTGVSVAPVGNQLLYDNIYQERYMGLPSENREDFIQGSPVTHAKNLKGNLLLMHGTGDDNVHYQNAETVINELIKNNIQFDMMAYPNRSHGIREGKNTTRFLFQKMTNYFLQHMPPGGEDL